MVRNSFIIKLKCVQTTAMKSERPLERKLQVISGQTVKKNPNKQRKILWIPTKKFPASIDCDKPISSGKQGTKSHGHSLCSFKKLQTLINFRVNKRCYYKNHEVPENLSQWIKERLLPGASSLGCSKHERKTWQRRHFAREQRGRSIVGSSSLVPSRVFMGMPRSRQPRDSWILSFKAPGARPLNLHGHRNAAAARGLQSLSHSQTLPEHRGSTFPRWKPGLANKGFHAAAPRSGQAALLFPGWKGGGEMSSSALSPQAERCRLWDVPQTTKKLRRNLPASLKYRWWQHWIKEL